MNYFIVTFWFSVVPLVAFGTLFSQAAKEPICGFAFDMGNGLWITSVTAQWRGLCNGTLQRVMYDTFVLPRLAVAGCAQKSIVSWMAHVKVVGPVSKIGSHTRLLKVLVDKAL